MKQTIIIFCLLSIIMAMFFVFWGFPFEEAKKPAQNYTEPLNAIIEAKWIPENDQVCMDRDLYNELIEIYVLGGYWRK